MIVANWKCNGSKAMINEWTNNFLINYVEMKKAFIGIAPPSIYIESILDTKLSKFEEINIGSQDIDISSGARTGAISSEMILDFDCKFSIIGHSESREFLGETNEDIFDKYSQLIKHSIKPIICIGESSKVREDNLFSAFITEQLELFKDVEDELIIAYEPIWAIGSGVIPDLKDIQETHNVINYHLKEIYPNSDYLPRIVYGGSVDNSNIDSIMSLKNVDGVLVGSASLDCKKFCDIVLSVGKQND